MNDFDFDYNKNKWDKKLKNLLNTQYNNLSSDEKKKVFQQNKNNLYGFDNVDVSVHNILNQRKNKHVSEWQKRLTKFLSKTYKNLPSDIKHTAIKQNLNHPYNYSHVRVDVNKKLYHAVMPELRENLQTPLIPKHKLDLLEAYAIRVIIHNRGLSNKIFCGDYIDMGQTFCKWLIFVLNKNKQDRQIYLKSFADTVFQHYQQHSKHLRTWEYILIPLVLFMLPNVVSAFLMFITGGFFIFIGTGAMMYAEHFVTVYAIPRLVLAVIGDGIAYWINKKRDE